MKGKLIFKIKTRKSWEKGLVEWFGWSVKDVKKAFAFVERNNTPDTLSVVLCSISGFVEYLEANRFQWNR